MTIKRHPREFAPCQHCGLQDPDWQPKRDLPQVGQTFECPNCGHEAYAYDAGDLGETSRQWRPVTRGMLTSLQFWRVASEWPDSATEDLLKQGLERAEAIDYHVVEREGLSQSEWADRTDRAQPTVSENVNKAIAKLTR